MSRFLSYSIPSRRRISRTAIALGVLGGVASPLKAQTPKPSPTPTPSSPTWKASESGIEQVLKWESSSASKEEIVAHLQDAIKKYGNNDPWVSKAYYSIGSIQSSLNQPEKALKNMDLCLRFPEPHSGLHVAAQNMRMNLLRQMGKTEEALKSATALSKMPGSGETNKNLISNAREVRTSLKNTLAHSQGKGSPLAAQMYREFLKEGKNYSASDLRSLGGTLAEAGLTKEAIQVYNEFLRRYPKNYDSALVALERQRLIRGGVSKVSAAELKEICDRYPTDTGPGQGALYEYGMALHLEGKNKEAIEQFRSVLHFNGTGVREHSFFLSQTAGEMMLRSLEAASKRERELLDVAAIEREARSGIQTVNAHIAASSGKIDEPIPMWKRIPVLIALALMALVGGATAWRRRR
jgi:tetratricopeptide (TPR) repeat protein